jgi:hypothetical protein
MTRLQQVMLRSTAPTFVPMSATYLFHHSQRILDVNQLLSKMHVDAKVMVLNGDVLHLWA